MADAPTAPPPSSDAYRAADEAIEHHVNNPTLRKDLNKELNDVYAQQATDKADAWARDLAHDLTTGRVDPQLEQSARKRNIDEIGEDDDEDDDP